MPHKLDSLLRPQSIAVVGASKRQEVVGNTVLKNLLAGNYPGTLYAVNPGYSEIEGLDCFASLNDLPGPVEHVIFAVSDKRIEEAFDAAIEHGIKAGTIFSSLVLADDTSPSLRERIFLKAEKANILLCGGNGMGFYNFTHNTWACGFDTRSHRQQGNVTLISQSGAGMSGILDVDERIDFNFAVSTGQELIITAEDYLDYALDQPETRVVGFFMETSRYPGKLLAAFEKARLKKIPIVVLKVGRTALSAQLAQSHSGAMAGSDHVYNAIYDYYGVQRVDDMDQLATTLIMFAQPHPLQSGGIVSIHDSGGERQLLIDLADKLGVALANISAETGAKLEALLDPGLPAVNPLDAWSVGGPEFHRSMTKCFTTLLNDPDAALGAVVHDRAPRGHIYSDYVDYLRDSHQATGKPVFLVANRQGTGEDPQVVKTTREGFPVLDGVSAFLSGARCLLAYRDFLARPAMRLPVMDENILSKWRASLDQGGCLDEYEAARLLVECGIPVNHLLRVESSEELLRIASTIEYPVVMKSAQAGLQHKSEKHGVILDIGDEAGLLKAYADLSSRLGEKVLIAPMISAHGIELLLGVARDEQFGPVIIMGLGGIYTELLNEFIILAPPFDAEYAMRRLQQLRLQKIAQGVRGKAALDLPAYCRAAARLSVLALEFQEQIKEVDINPLLVMEQGCLGLDALLIPAGEVSPGEKTSYA